MGKKSADTPDIVGAANTEGQYSEKTARDMNYANRPDQYNAFGNSTWQQESVRDPATGEMTTKWSQRQNLSPDMQNMFDQEVARDTQLGNLSVGMGDRIAQEMGAPLDWEQFGDVMAGPSAQNTGDFSWDSTANRGRAEDDAYARSTRRLDPQFESDRATLETQMAGRGLRAGDSAYDSAMANYSTGKNDAYEMARLGATAEGRTEDQQAYGQAKGAYDTNRATANQNFNQQLSSNERANALRGQQIQEYIGKRGQSLSESNALKDSQGLAEATQTFGGG
jgi:hypothetical protein